ncbi:MAG TPA: PKD domain-containing protein, partial [Bacteroidales bacterium]|nr:PKD domain-containing protein [Bacteroidales bacterium]
VTVKDKNNCSVTTLPVTIIAPPALTVSLDSKTDVLCFANSTGAINVTVAGGVMPAGGYFFTWTGTDYLSVPYSGNIEDLTSLKAGTYNLSVRDANGCTATLGPITITQPSALTVSLTGQVNVLCYGDATGAINITAAGGAPGYTYAWTGTDYLGAAFTSASEDPSGLLAGAYNLTVTDANMCTVALATVNISQPPDLVVTLNAQTNVSCFGDATGAISVTVTGGVKPSGGYVFEWTGSDYLGTVFTSSTEDLTALKAGTYNLKVTDLNSCSFNLAPVVITQPAALTPGSIGANQVLCYGASPAKLTELTAATGGPAPYDYQWQSSFNIAGPFLNIPGAQAIDYTPAAMPSSTMYYRRALTSGTCPAVFSNVVEVKVNPLPLARLTGGATICAGESSVIKVEIMVGSGPYDIDIENYGNIPAYVSSSDITVSPAVTTTYRILRIKDANGCEVTNPHANLTGTATVKVRALPVITSSPVNSTICEYGATTFNATATGDDITWQWFVDKGTGFEILPEGGVQFGTQTPTLNIFGGTRLLNNYKYHAVATGCGTSVTTADALLTVNISPSIDVQPVEKTICQTENTTFSVTATGTGLTYQWQVNTGSGFSNVTDGGVYSGATTNTLALTNVPGSFNAYIYRVIVSGMCPSPAYSNFVVLRVTVPPVVTLNPVSKSICDAAGTVYFTGNGSGMINEMRWQVDNAGTWTDLTDDAVYSGTNTQQLAFINPPVSLNGKQYRLALRAACATVYTTPATLTVYSNPVVTFAPNPVINCGGAELTMSPVISAGSGTWTQHTWTGEVGPLNKYDIKNPLFKSLIDETYDLTYRVKDSNGCYGSANVAVVVDSPDASFTQDKTEGCTPLNVSFTKDMTGIASWKWDFGDGSPVNTTDANPIHNYVNATGATIQYRTVKLTVKSAGGCEITKTSMVTVYPAISADFTKDKALVCNGDQITFTGVSGANTYTWDYGDGISAAGSYVTTHVYTNTTADPIVRTVKLNVASFYGCPAEKSLFITVLPKPVPQFSAAPVTQVYNASGNPVTFTNET